MQSEIRGKGMRYAADVGVVRYMMVTSGWSSTAMNSHALVVFLTFGNENRACFQCPSTVNMAHSQIWLVH